MHYASIIYKPFFFLLSIIAIPFGTVVDIRMLIRQKLPRCVAWIIMQTDSSDVLNRIGYDTLELSCKILTVELVKKCLNKRFTNCNRFFFYFKILRRKTRQSNHLRLPSIKLCVVVAIFNRIL